jgi:sugar lactone lactonase YvrE
MDPSLGIYYPRLYAGLDTVNCRSANPLMLKSLLIVGAMLALAASALVADESHPLIPIRFTLSEPGFVTLVLDDAGGRRVRNLVSETKYAAGENVVWWDGLDDLGRDDDAANHGIYHVPGQRVAPGNYRVRGLWRPQIDLRYEFSVYNPGQPPWKTASLGSEWLANHTPPSGVLFIPEVDAKSSPAGATAGGQVIVCSQVTEGGSGLAWLDLDGRKLRGQMWVGGVWTGATHLARDDGENRVPGVYGYTGAVWEGGGFDGPNSELRLAELLTRDCTTASPSDSRFGRGDDRPLLTPTAPYQGLLPSGAKQLPTPSQDNRYIFPDKEHTALGGLAVHNGLLVASLQKMNQLLLVDAANRKILGTVAMQDPRGLAFDHAGRLLVLSANKLLRLSRPQAPESAVVLTSGLQDPHGLTLDDSGNIYVSDWGQRHQVKVFAADGSALRTLGEPGGPQLGRYDPARMHSPNGLAIDSRQRLWVAETDYTPKRLSVWTLDGKLVRAFYGPMGYGGGGSLDPVDASRFYYNGIQFNLDWQTGSSEPESIYYLPQADALHLPGLNRPAPETPILVDGRRYLTDCYNTSPTNGGAEAALWLMKEGVAVPAAALGSTASWGLLKTAPFWSLMPWNAFWAKSLFVWSDINGDGQVQPKEIQIVKGQTAGITVMPDLAFVAAYVDGKAVRYAPTGFTAQGVPRYDLSKGQVLVSGTRLARTSGGGQALVGENGWTILTVPPEPYAPQSSQSGALNGQPLWVYPSLWPGLHPSHAAPLPEFSGELIGTTRLLGGLIKPLGSDIGQLWAVNGNKGNTYLFSTDGLFVATLFKDCRTASWSPPEVRRGMLVNELSQNEENFWPSITQLANGKVYMVTGASGGSIIEVQGLDKIKRLPDQVLQVNVADLLATQDFAVRHESERQNQQPTRALTVAIRATPPTVDGKLDDWAGADWAIIDQPITKARDSGRKPEAIRAALAISGDRLFAAFQTYDPNLLRNSGERLPVLFKTGGALDLMIGVDPAACPSRETPVEGDQRLLITKVGDQLVAILYRAVVKGTTKPVVFSSPSRTITIDRVDNVTAKIQFSSGADGFYEFSIPLSSLALKPESGRALRGDLGILRGNGYQTLERKYWQNKATGLTSDVPSEALLLPKLWGTLILK